MKISEFVEGGVYQYQARDRAYYCEMVAGDWIALRPIALLGFHAERGTYRGFDPLHVSHELPIFLVVGEGDDNNCEGWHPLAQEVEAHDFPVIADAIAEYGPRIAGQAAARLLRERNLPLTGRQVLGCPHCGSLMPTNLILASLLNEEFVARCSELAKGGHNAEG